jgi:putative hydrolase of the HAD superfamily
MKAVMFDLWGTLVPFPPGSLDDVLARLADELDVPQDTLTHHWSKTWPLRATGDLRVYLRDLCDMLGVNPTPTRMERAFAIRVDAHARLFVPRADALAVLTQLRSRGLRIGLITNCTSEVPELWSRSPLADWVDEAVFSSSERLMKPDARIYELATERLGVHPAECLYVGDGADTELEGARAVGMAPVLLRPGDTTPPPWTGPEIGSLLEVLTLV